MTTRQIKTLKNIWSAEIKLAEQINGVTLSTDQRFNLMETLERISLQLIHNACTPPALVPSGNPLDDLDKLTSAVFATTVRLRVKINSLLT